MRLMAWVVALGSVVGLRVAGEMGWQLARDPGTGCWPPSCQAGQVPLATPVLAHAGRLLMVGDGAAPNDGYESPDGRIWRRFTHDAGWGARYRAADISHDGFLWRVGGWVEEDGQRVSKNDVWRSRDGHHWERVLANAPWSPRSGAQLLSFRDTLWLLGGDPEDQQLWLTVDGRRWIARTPLGLPDELPQGFLAHRNAMWIVGRGAWESATNDVWKSVDGTHWQRVTAAAQWPARTGAAFAVLNDRLWIVAGVGHRDTWSSADGLSWQRLPDELPGPPRSAVYSTVFRDALWVVGGKTGGAGGTGFWDGIAVLK